MHTTKSYKLIGYYGNKYNLHMIMVGGGYTNWQNQRYIQNLTVLVFIHITYLEA